MAALNEFGQLLMGYGRALLNAKRSTPATVASAALEGKSNAGK
ncbi:hypothetical protein [Mesorhizobium sp.]|nr:hypothetical protein [Mesorhizobium sp.]